MFIRNGYDGARMQDIATNAGINKALLHYYFRSKENLFEKIFQSKLKDFLPKLSTILFSEVSLIEKMELFVDQYMDLLTKNPYLPIFVLQTVHKNPDFIKELPKEIMQGLIEYFNGEIEKGKIKKVDPEQFIPSLIGMCVFPFAANPVIKHMFAFDNKQFDQFIQQRKKALKAYVRAILLP